MIILQHNPHDNQPESPFKLIGEMVSHYSTGTKTVRVFSDDIGVDLSACYEKANFNPCSDYLPEFCCDGYMFKFRKHYLPENGYQRIALLKTNGVIPPKGQGIQIIRVGEYETLLKEYLFKLTKNHKNLRLSRLKKH